MKRPHKRPARRISAKTSALRITIELDDGLAPYLRALVASPAGIFGNEHDTIVYAVRTFLIDMMKNGSGFRNPIVDQLPPDLKAVWLGRGSAL